MGKRNRLYVGLEASNVWSPGIIRQYMQCIGFLKWAHYSGYFHGNVDQLITGNTKQSGSVCEVRRCLYNLTIHSSYYTEHSPS